MTEIKSHTSLRGIAALLVVILHFRVILTPIVDLDSYTHFFLKGYLWVDCFFILSGFILCYVYGTRPGETKADCNNFLRARFARIYPLHLATLIALAFLFFLRSSISHQPFAPDWMTFFLNLIDIHAWGFLSAYDWNFPSWSISVEFAAYLAFPLICIGIMKTPKLTFTVMSVCFVMSLFLGHDDWERLALYQGIPQFFAGVIIFHLPVIQRTALIQIGATIVLLAALHFGWHDSVATICFAALVYSTQMDTGPVQVLTSAPFLALGTWSYSIYMLHIPVRFYYFTLGLKTGPVASFLVLLTLTLIAGALSYRFFEMPARRFLTARIRVKPSYRVLSDLLPDRDRA